MRRIVSETDTPDGHCMLTIFKSRGVAAPLRTEYPALTAILIPLLHSPKTIERNQRKEVVISSVFISKGVSVNPAPEKNGGRHCRREGFYDF